MIKINKILSGVGKHSSYVKGMATMLAITLIFSAGKSYAGVSDNIGSGFYKLGKLLGIGKESNVPADKTAYDSATLLEKINYLEKENSLLQAGLNDLSAQVNKLKASSGGNALNMHFVEKKITYGDAATIKVDGPCKIYIAIAEIGNTEGAANRTTSYDLVILSDKKTIFNGRTWGYNTPGPVRGFFVSDATYIADYTEGTSNNIKVGNWALPGKKENWGIDSMMMPIVVDKTFSISVSNWAGVTSGKGSLKVFYESL